MSDPAIGDCIIAGIASGDGPLEQMSEIVTHLEQGGFVIVPKSAIDWLDGSAQPPARKYGCSLPNGHHGGET